MQACHCHIFQFFKEPGSLNKFSNLWILMLSNWKFSKHCVCPAKAWGAESVCLHALPCTGRDQPKLCWACSPAPQAQPCQNCKTGSCALFVSSHSTQPALFWMSFMALFCAHKILFRYGLCFGSHSCTPNYADEWKDVTKYYTCSESQSIKPRRACLRSHCPAFFKHLFLAEGQ